MRALWIVDGAYLLRCAGKIDFLRLRRLLEDLHGEPLREGYFLNSSPDPQSDHSSPFHTFLKSAPPRGPQLRVQLYGLKGMPCECPQCGGKFERKVQKGVDVGIATLIVKLASQDRYDRLFLIAGDGDFEDAIAYVKGERNKELVLCGFENSLSADLQSYADQVVWLDQHQKALQRS